MTRRAGLPVFLVGKWMRTGERADELCQHIYDGMESHVLFVYLAHVKGEEEEFETLGG